MSKVQSNSDIRKVPVMKPGNQRQSFKEVNITECDPTLISTLFQEHCIFCLVKKSRTFFSINSKSTIQIDGYELLRRYFGIKTADCLNDVFDATVFKNKALITSEFPASLLCESCVRIIRELDVLHKKLELVQRQILRRVREVRKLIVSNSTTGDTQEEPSDNRFEFEASMLECCDNDKGKMEMMISILDNIHHVLQEETDDLIEIHLDHLEKVDPFPAEEEDSVEECYAMLFPSKDTVTASTQTDADSFTFQTEKYNVKILSHQAENEGDSQHPTVSSPLGSTQDDNFNDDFDDHNLGSPPEIAEAMEVEDLKHEVVASIKDSPSQTLEPSIESQITGVVAFEQKSAIPEIPAIGESDTTPTPPQPETPCAPPTPQPETPCAPPTPQPETPCAPPTPQPETPCAPPTPQPQVQQSGNGIIIIKPAATSSRGITIVKSKRMSKGKRAKEESESDSEDYDCSESGSSSESEDSSDDEDQSENSSGGEKESAKSKIKQERTTSRPKQFKCRYCSTMFSKRHDVYCHMRTIHKLEPKELQTITLHLSCTHCDFDCEKLSELRRHLKDTHKKEPSKRINSCVYECDMCGFSKRKIRFAKFLNHLRQHEHFQRFNECEDCLQKFTTKQMYQLHPCPQAGRLPGSAIYTECVDAIRKETEFKCRICNPSVLSDSERSLQIHFEIHHENLHPFSCDICEGHAGFRFKIDLKNHMIQAHNANKFKCRICEKKLQFKSYNDLHVHMNYEHFGSYFTCPYNCFDRFTSMKQLECHLISHKDKKLVICRKCEQGFNSRSNLSRHKCASDKQSTEPPKPPPSRRRWTCSYCDYVCSNSGTLRYHLQHVHGILEERKVNTRTYTCEICGFTNSTCRIFRFLDHLQTHENRKNKNFHCEDCMDSFTTKQLFQIHICPQTGKLPGTATVNTKGREMKKIIMEYVCRICNAKLTGDRQLQTHSIKEHGVNAFACEICGDMVAFKTRNDFKMHMITSHNAVPYKCRLCLPVKTFTKYFHMFSHTNMEHLGNIYKCPQCDKKFILRGHLEKHLTTHSDERKFICTFCGRTQKTNSGLRKHVKSMHTEGVRMHMCEYCSKEFREKGNLKKHVQKLHLQQTQTEDPRRSPRKRRKIDND